MAHRRSRSHEVDLRMMARRSMISLNEAKPSGRLQNGFFLWKKILLGYGERAKHSLRSWDGAELREVTEATEAAEN